MKMVWVRDKSKNSQAQNRETANPHPPQKYHLKEHGRAEREGNFEEKKPLWLAAEDRQESKHSQCT